MYIEPHPDALEPNRSPIGRMLAVGSGKGGVGKTFLAVQLAYALAQEGENVLLFDGDLGLANADVQLGLRPEHDLTATITGDVALEDAVTPVAGGAGGGGFDLLPGRSGDGGLADLDTAALTQLCAGLAALALTYDRVILDLAAGVDATVMRLASEADDVLVVVQDEPTSITDAYAFVKRLRATNAQADPLVAVNAVDDRDAAEHAAGTLARTCRSFLGFAPRLAGAVRRDPQVREAIRRQELLALRRPETAAAQDISALAGALASR